MRKGVLARTTEHDAVNFRIADERDTIRTSSFVAGRVRAMLIRIDNFACPKCVRSAALIGSYRPGLPMACLWLLNCSHSKSYVLRLHKP